MLRLNFFCFNLQLLVAEQSLAASCHSPWGDLCGLVGSPLSLLLSRLTKPSSQSLSSPRAVQHQIKPHLAPNTSCPPHPPAPLEQSCPAEGAAHLSNDLGVHGAVVVEALGPARRDSLADLRAVHPALQRRVPADGIEAAVATDGAFVWNLLGKTLAHYGLR